MKGQTSKYSYHKLAFLPRSLSLPAIRGVTERRLITPYSLQVIKLSREVEMAFPQYSLHLYKERYESEKHGPLRDSWGTRVQGNLSNMDYLGTKIIVLHD